MDHRKCKACHHEWDGDREECDWCGAASCVIGTLSWEPVWSMLGPVMIEVYTESEIDSLNPTDADKGE